MDYSAKPLIYVTKEQGLKVEPRGLFKGNFPKILFIILGVIILGEAIWGVRTILSPNKQPAPQVAQIGQGKIVLDAPKSNYQIGETVPVQIRLVTGGISTYATDAVLKYDPKILQATSADIKIGKIFPDYPVADLDQTLGEVKVSGITAPNSPGFAGIGEMATVNFKAIGSGKTVISVDFQKESTIDSNVIETGTTHDVLGEVYNKELFIGSAQTTQVSKNNKLDCSGFIQLCQNSSGQTGRQFCRVGSVQNNECRFDPNLSVSCDECKVVQ